MPCVDEKNLQAIAIQGIPPIKAECKELLRRSGRAGQKIRLFNEQVPQGERSRNIRGPRKMGDAKGCPLGGFLVTFVPGQK